MDKELIIATLRKQLGELKSLCSDVNRMESEITLLIDELSDESKLGAPSEYDFGSTHLRKTMKDIIKSTKINIKSLTGVAETIDLLQQDIMKENTSVKDEFSKD